MVRRVWPNGGRTMAGFSRHRRSWVADWNQAGRVFHPHASHPPHRSFPRRRSRHHAALRSAVVPSGPSALQGRRPVAAAGVPPGALPARGRFGVILRLFSKSRHETGKIKANQGQSRLIKGCASEVDRNAGASPARRVRLFTTEHDLNSVAARRGWKLRKMSRRAVMKMNHI